MLQQADAPCKEHYVNEETDENKIPASETSGDCLLLSEMFSTKQPINRVHSKAKSPKFISWQTGDRRKTTV
jgi:hypothetical protein